MEYVLYLYLNLNTEFSSNTTLVFKLHIVCICSFVPNIIESYMVVFISEYRFIKRNKMKNSGVQSNQLHFIHSTLGSNYGKGGIG
jgi:hypothetical protein